MKKIIQNLWRVVFVSVLVFGFQFSLAEGGVNLVVKNNGVEVGAFDLALPGAGVSSISDSEGAPHDVDARSVLKLLNDADQSSSDFNISSLIYYPSFSAFYLKCMEVSGEDLCDDWQYNIDGDSPGVGMGDSILSGGESVVVFFGSEDAPEEDVPPEPEPEPEPEPVPEPEEAPRSHGSSGSRVSGSMPVVSKEIESKTPAPVLAELPKVEPVVEVPKIEPVVSAVKKNVPVKKIAKIPKPAIQNTATVLNAIEQSETPVESKQISWFGRFFGWLFGF
jgi:hypothetical protein